MGPAEAGKNKGHGRSLRNDQTLALFYVDFRGKITGKIGQLWTKGARFYAAKDSMISNLKAPGIVHPIDIE